MEKDSTDNQLLQVESTIQHKKSTPQTAFVQISFSNALLPLFHCLEGLEQLSAPPVKMCL